MVAEKVARGARFEVFRVAFGQHCDGRQHMLIQFQRMPEDIITIFGGTGVDGAPGDPGKLIGEDTADLLLAIQDAFQIEFPEEGPFPQTIGQLSNLVVSCLKGTKTSKCLTSVTFYRFRRALMDVTGVPRGSVTPTTRLGVLLARGPRRRRQWRDLEWRTGLRFPGLTHPASVIWGLLVIMLGGATRISVLEATGAGWFSLLLLTAGSWFVAGIFALLVWGMTLSLAWALPRRTRTVGDLVGIVLAKNYGSLAKEAGGWSETEVWRALRELIADEISLNKDEITKDTAFPDGLNIW